MRPHRGSRGAQPEANLGFSASLRGVPFPGNAPSTCPGRGGAHSAPAPPPPRAQDLPAPYLGPPPPGPRAPRPTRGERTASAGPCLAAAGPPSKRKRTRSHLCGLNSPEATAARRSTAVRVEQCLPGWSSRSGCTSQPPSFPSLLGIRFIRIYIHNKERQKRAF